MYWIIPCHGDILELYLASVIRFRNTRRPANDVTIVSVWSDKLEIGVLERVPRVYSIWYKFQEYINLARLTGLMHVLSIYLSIICENSEYTHIILLYITCLPIGALTFALCALQARFHCDKVVKILRILFVQTKNKLTLWLGTRSYSISVYVRMYCVHLRKSLNTYFRQKLYAILRVSKIFELNLKANN